MGRPLLMGRKTFEAIGRPLPGRETIVMTRNDAFGRRRASTRSQSLAAALRCMDERARAMGVDEAMVVGGADVYAALLPFATEIHMTEVDLEPDGDALFPVLDDATGRKFAREYPRARRSSPSAGRTTQPARCA